MFSLIPPSFLIWQIYFPASAGSAFENCRVATFSTNVILMFSLSLTTSSFSLSHWTEIGWVPSMDACNSAGSPATTVRLFSLETNLGGSEQGKMDGDCWKDCPDNEKEKTKPFCTFLPFLPHAGNNAYLLVLQYKCMYHYPLHSVLCSGIHQCLKCQH